MIPEAWETKPLRRLFAFTNGVNAAKVSYGRGFRFVNVLEPITYSHLYGPEIPGRVAVPDAVAKAYAVKLGDVVFNRTSETDAELGLASVYLGTEHVVFGGFVIRGRPTDESLDPTYCGYALRAPFIRAQIVPMGQGAVRANIGQKNLGLVVAPVPPKPEQRAIAAALSDVDALLTGLDRLIAKKRDLKQAAMQQLLTGQTRLPGFHGGWEVRRLGEMADISKGEQLRSHDTDVEGDVPHYNGGISPSNYTHKANVSADSIAISEGGNSCGYVQFITRPFWCGGHCYSVKPRSVDKRYLYHALKGRQQSIMGLRVGSGLPNVQKTALREFSFAVPKNLDEQTSIATVLSDMDAELSALEARRDKTRALKQAMMQELLTGRTRLIRSERVEAAEC